MSQVYLAHFGIIGQKWGKKNGPPYPLSNANRSSAERKANPESKSSKEKKKSGISNINRQQVGDIRNDADTLVRYFSKRIPRKYQEDLSKYSDVELQKIVNRQRLEQQYKDLNPDKIDAGASIIRETLQTAGAAAGLYLTYKTVKKMS
jgi:hypothetical protein